MRRLAWAMGVAVATGCAPLPRVTIESVVELAAANPVAADRNSQHRDVLVAGTIRDFAFQIQDAGRGKRRRRPRPYVSVLTPGGTTVYCFPMDDNQPSFDLLSKGQTARFPGVFGAFSRGDAGDLQVTLGDCRIAD